MPTQIYLFDLFPNHPTTNHTSSPFLVEVKTMPSTPLLVTSTTEAGVSLIRYRGLPPTSRGLYILFKAQGDALRMGTYRR